MNEKECWLWQEIIKDIELQLECPGIYSFGLCTAISRAFRNANYNSDLYPATISARKRLAQFKPARSPNFYWPCTREGQLCRLVAATICLEQAKDEHG